MKLLLQGMRRSGTSIVYKTFREDDRFASFYEPLAAARVPETPEQTSVQMGFESVRQLRAAFLETRSSIAWQDLNHGAPRDPSLELDEAWPEFVCDYLSLMLGQKESVLAKFTRAYQKLGQLAALSPDAHLVVIVRDPRAVVTSYLGGHKGRDADSVETPQAFFSRRSQRQAWNFYAFSELICARLGVPTDELCDYQRVLVVWRHCVEHALQGAMRHFANRWSLLKLHDFIAEPEAQISQIYADLDEPCPDSVLTWARSHVGANQRMMAPEDSRWNLAFSDLGIDEIISRHALLDPSF